MNSTYKIPFSLSEVSKNSDLIKFRKGADKMQQIPIAGRKVNPIGLGTLNMGEDLKNFDQEVSAIRTGIDNGMQAIDTAEMYGSGKAETFVGEAIAPYNREELFLISKVLPSNASKRQLPKSLDNSLKRMNTDYLDLYLLHWPGPVPLQETVEALEKEKNKGKIKAWGVSNLDINDMNKLLQLPQGENCATNQVRYNIIDRGIEYDLMPKMDEYHMPVMSYAPVVRRKFSDKQNVLEQIAEKHQATIHQVLLAWNIRNKNTIAIPQSSKAEHVYDNSQAVNIELTKEDLEKIDEVYPKPTSSEPLALW